MRIESRLVAAVVLITAGLTATACSSPTEAESEVWTISHDFPRVVTRGQEVTFTTTMVGRAGAGSWSRSTLIAGWRGPVVTLPPDFLISWEGAGVATTRSAYDSVEIIVQGRDFAEGSRLSVTATVLIRSDIPSGTKTFFLLPYVDNLASGGGHVSKTLDYEIEVR